jgi:hypothetical protein
MPRETKAENKMIQIKVYLWTDQLAPKKGAILPKHAWEGGWVFLPANKLHGIRANRKKAFHRFSELLDTVGDILRQNGINIHEAPPRRKTASKSVAT